MKANKLIYGYDQTQNLFNGLDVTLPREKVTTIIGANGCGKSTLLGLLTKAFHPTGGEITLDGINIKTIKGKHFSKKVAMVHQQNASKLEMTIEELVSYGRSPYEGFCLKDKEGDNLVDWALECMKLTEIRHKPLSALSGGQRQRAWIAMSICQKSDILFLDEPTTYLDIHYQIELLELIQKLNEEHKITIVMVLHDINQALRYSDHVIVMKQGQIVREGRPIEVIDEALLEEVYSIRGKVIQEDGYPYIVPQGIV